MMRTSEGSAERSRRSNEIRPVDNNRSCHANDLRLGWEILLLDVILTYWLLVTG